MSGAHPSVEELLARPCPDAVRPHLDACPSCRLLAGLSDPVARAASGQPDAEAREAARTAGPLPVVDRALYADFEELSDRRGGMGRLFRARDTRLGRVVAIKMLHEAGAGGGKHGDDPAIRAELRRRFEREARLTARLEHPAIVGVHEAGVWEDGEPFYAMRFVDGVPLDEEMARHKTLAERLGLLANLTVVADALAYAHDRRIVHRDVKPRNVLVGRFGETVLIDWGLAKDLDGPSGDEGAPLDAPIQRDGLTQLGVGTPQYMPPEQASGDAAGLRMDVYALGATIYHALSGAAPYGAGDSFAIRRRLAVGPPRPLAEVAPDVPPELQAIVAKAMDRDPSARFPTARELAEELHRFQAGQLLRTHHYTPRELVRHWTRRNRTPLRIAALAGVALAVFGAVSVARVVRERNRAEASERGALSALQRAQGITASKFAADPETRIDALSLGVEAVIPSIRAGEAPPREAVQGLLDAITLGPARRTLGEHSQRTASFTADMARDRYALSGDDRVTNVWDVVTGRLLGRHAGVVPQAFLRFSHDGERLVACGVDRRAETWTLPDGPARFLAAESLVIGCGFLPDGRIVTAADALVVWDASGNEAARFPLPASASTFDVAHDGRVAVGTLDGAVTVWDPRTGASSRALAHSVEPNGLAFAHDGSFLVSSARDGRIVQYVPDPGGVMTRLVDLPDTAFGHTVLISPAGRFVIAESNAGYARFKLLIFDRQAAPGEGRTLVEGASMPAYLPDDSRMLLGMGEELQLRETRTGRPILRLPTRAPNPIFTKDATRVVQDDFMTSRLHVWDMRTGAASGMLLGHTSEVSGAWLSPDRARYLTSSLDGSARTWDAVTGAALATVDTGAPLVGAAWSPDGASFVTAGLDGAARIFAAGGAPGPTFTMDGPLAFAAFAPDGHALATCASDGAVVVWDAPSGAARVRIASAPTAIVLAFSPDGARLVVGYGDGVVRAYDAATGALLATSPDLDGDKRDGVTALFFTAGGARLLAGVAAGRTAILDPVQLTAAGEIPGRPASAWSSPFSPDGRRVLTTVPGGTVRVTDLTGAPPVEWKGNAVALQAAFSRDGQIVIAADSRGVVRAWPAHGGDALVVLDPRTGEPATALALAPDARFALTGYASGALRLHPIGLEAAIDRACGALAYLGRPSDACDTARNPRNANHDR